MKGIADTACAHLDQHYEMTTWYGAGSPGGFRVDAVSAEHNVIRPCKPLYNVRKGNTNYQIRLQIVYDG